MAGTALAVAPTAYVLRPGSAYAAVCAPGALCNDGYTEFCCTIYGANRCPRRHRCSAAGGRSTARDFCGGGPRYYMDCNAACNGCGCGANGVCAGSCSGTGCGCANGDCNNRKAGCTAFRYGQCNQGVPCLGPIVCRVVTCTEPWRIDGTCTTASRTDNRTRYHSRPCLEVDALGSVDAVTVVPGGVRVSGWALDPSTPGLPITINVYDCLRPVGAFQAALSRPDVGAIFGKGSDHGYDVFFRLCPGDRLVSVAAVDTSGQGSNWIGHQMVRIDPNPIGHFDTLTASVGSLRVTGFVLDPDAYRAVSVDVYVDGVLATSVVANGYRPDVAAAYPHMGGEYGFDVTIAASPGFHNVCIVGRNANGGADLDLGCRATTVPSDPSGVVESVTSPGPGSARVRGWARDPETASPISVQVTVDGVPVGTFAANRARGDGNNGYGFDETITGLTPGARSVCVTAVNVGGGSNVSLGCSTVGVAAVAVGQVLALDAVAGGVHVATTEVLRVDGSPATVRVLVDGQFRASLRPGPGGLDEVLTVPAGDHEVVVVATVDGPRTIPPVLASALLTVPPAVGAPDVDAAPAEQATVPAPDPVVAP